MNYVNSFKLYLTADMNASANTVDGYIRDINSFLVFVPDKDITSISTSDIRAYISFLQGEGKARSTIYRATCSIKSFFKYLKEVEKVISMSPAEEIKLINRGKSLPKAVGEDDVLKIINTSSSLGVRYRLILELLYGSGARVSEVISLTVEDIDFDNCFIRLLGKGDKERYNPIHEGCIELIEEYMRVYNIYSGFLFPHRDDPSRHMTREGAYQMVKRISSLSGVDPNTISPHVFRHSFAQHLLDNGCDMSLVQEYLGHEDISTTRIYAKITKGNKSNNFKKFHPLAR